MKNRTKWLTGALAAAGLAPGLLADRAMAQVPAVPPAPAAVPAAGVPAPGDLGVPPPGGLLGNLIKAKAYCHAKLCASPLGQLINNGLKPVTLFSGGIIPPLCPPNAPNPADLALRPDSPLGAAAAIKADTAAAAARRAAVRYLGTVDCHYWPEAQLALANALRTDRNYCVRREAAYALLNGCCCTRITVEALSIAVSGSDRDGNPSETDEQVKATAMLALQHCLDCLGAVPPSALPLATPPSTKPIERVPNPKERVPEPTPTGPVSKNDNKPSDKIVPVAAKTVTRTRVKPAEYYKHIEESPWADIVTNARKTLQNARQTTSATARQDARQAPGLLNMFARSIEGPASAEYAVETPAPRLGTPHPVETPRVVYQTPAPVVTSQVVYQTPPAVEMSPAVVSSPFHAHSSQPMNHFGSATVTVVEQPAPATPQLEMTTTARPVPVTAASRISMPEMGMVRATPPGQVRVATVASSIHDAHVAPVSFQMPTPAVPATTAPAKPLSMMEQLMLELQTSPDANRRVWAAGSLSTVDGWSNSAAVQALVRGARKDRDVTVRVACIRGLAHMQVTSQLVIGTIQDLHADPDPTIQEAARKALGQLCSLPGSDNGQVAR